MLSTHLQQRAYESLGKPLQIQHLSHCPEQRMCVLILPSTKKRPTTPRTPELVSRGLDTKCQKRFMLSCDGCWLVEGRKAWEMQPPDLLCSFDPRSAACIPLCFKCDVHVAVVFTLPTQTTPIKQVTTQ